MTVPPAVRVIRAHPTSLNVVYAYHEFTDNVSSRVCAHTPAIIASFKEVAQYALRALASPGRSPEVYAFVDTHWHDLHSSIRIGKIYFKSTRVRKGDRRDIEMLL